MSIWSETDVNYLYENYSILTHKQMAAYLNRTQESVKLKCKKLRLLRVPRHIIYEDYFDTWSSNMAYILGFIMADGCVFTNGGQNSLKIDIHKKDIEILRFINSQLAQDNIIGYNYKKNQVRIGIGSPYLINRLISYGVIPRKTGYETMEHVPDKYKPDFIRGYFDGDGSISVRKSNGRFDCYICGSNLNLMHQLYEYFNFGKIEDKSINHNKFYRFNITRKCDLEAFRRVIYNGGFCLGRKRDLMMSIDTSYIKTRDYAK